jgi:hypothetical protein
LKKTEPKETERTVTYVIVPIKLTRNTTNLKTTPRNPETPKNQI